MTKRRGLLEVAALTWAAVAAGGAFGAMLTIDRSSVLLLSVIALVGPIAAMIASQLLGRGADRAAGALLLVSLLTPSYFSWVVSLPALAIGAALVAAPRLIVDPLELATVRSK